MNFTELMREHNAFGFMNRESLSSLVACLSNSSLLSFNIVLKLCAVIQQIQAQTPKTFLKIPSRCYFPREFNSRLYFPLSDCIHEYVIDCLI